MLVQETMSTLRSNFEVDEVEQERRDRTTMGAKELSLAGGDGGMVRVAGTAGLVIGISRLESRASMCLWKSSSHAIASAWCS